ncbi:hypothetical protein DW928_06295 [Firmicutes bacterium AM43-11BH]|nr:hypothetical protein DW928_06295 [Firmicutes bacterium AM43-11BH]
MDLMGAIGLLSSFVTLEEAGRSWVLIIKDKLKRKEIDINKWDSDDPLVQACLDRFKTDMGDKYKDHFFSEEEIQEIIRGFFEQNRALCVGIEEKKQITHIIKDILYGYNEYTKSLMSSGERTLHNTLSSDFSKIMNKLEVIEEQPCKENIKKFLRAIEISKEIELKNIEELINDEYEIDRSEIIETIQAGQEKLVSIQGNAGSGKSVICKKLLNGKKYVLVTRAENLSTGKKVNDLWDCDIEDAILWLENKPLYIFIDAIEFIADCGDSAFLLLQEIYRLADKYNNVYVITSCRTTDSSAFMKINTKYRIKTYEISDLTKDEIDKVAQKYPIISSLNQNKTYSDLLCVPFYLNLIISGGFVEENIHDENNFRNLIWDRIVCLKDKCRKYGVSQSDIRETVERIAFERASSFVVGVDRDIVDSNILEAMKSEGIIVESKNKIRLKYDIFEDICFERYIDKAFDACRGLYNDFFIEIEKIGRCIYRRYQIWISNKLFVQEAREKFVYTLLTDNSIEVNWKKQTEIGIVKSKYCELFFEEFRELLDEKVISDLIDITNLYAFEAKINHSPALIMNVTPIGAAREYLIGIVFEGRISLEDNRNSIIKLCDDYANYSYKTIETGEKACKIIIGYIDKLIEKSKEEKSYYQYDEEIAQLFLIVAKMAKASKAWLREFVENMIVEYRSEISRRDSIAEEILKTIVKKCPISFAMELPELACKSAETLWRQSVSRKHFVYDRYDYNKVRVYGLSDNANHFDNNENGVYNNTFLWYVMRYGFIKGLDWAISFINNAVQTFAENKPDEITNIEIYFPEENKKRVYWGNEGLWMADIMEHNLPVVLTDIVFVIKKTVINTMRNSSDSVYIKHLGEYVKKIIYEKANNILLLSIIEAIGMNYQKEVPEYAIELASSMELIYYDIHRSGEFMSNPTKELLEKQIMLSVGIPEITRRYEKDEKCAGNLQQYFVKSYLYGDDGIKNRCHVILDYLYSIYDEKTYPNENLQIQKMDFRNAAVTKIDENTIRLEPQIKGEAQKIVKDNEDTNEPISDMNETLNRLIKDINEKKADAGQIVSVINTLCEKMKDDYRIEMQFESVLVTLIASALIMSDVTDEQRNKLVEEWIKRVKKIFSNQSYVAEINMVIALWEQLNQDINNDLKEQILLMILESLFNDEKSGLISQMAELSKYFLSQNKKYASCIFNTIIMLAEDEMNHQKFNAAFIKENRNDIECEFIPNMVPKLYGVDQWIRDNKGDEYQNNKSQIIQDYLYNGKSVDFIEFDISNYDIDILCNIACCGLDTEDEKFVIVINSIVQCMIQIWHKNCKKIQAHEIIDTLQAHKVSSYFQRELNIIGRNPEAVYDILFKETNFLIFTRDTVDFYEDALSGFLPAYVDGFRENGKRDDIEKKIRILENYVNNIPEDYVRSILEKRLFLCKGRYSRWDVNKVKAEYSYKDKCFLNAQIEKYGSNHLVDVLYTIYLLNINELLPEILVSISSCFMKAIRYNKEQFAKEIKDLQVIVDMIILKSFIFHSDEIKKDEKLINAYEDMLLTLTEIKNEKAAVLLDEFRIH